MTGVPPRDDPSLRVGPLRAGDPERIAAWRYGGPWSVYDPRPGDAPVAAEDGYLAVRDADGRLVGFCCTGGQARVPGLVEEPGVLDVGVGMDPDLVGRGLGRDFGAAVLAHLVPTTPTVRRLRAVVQDWNTRSIRLAQAMGFAVVGQHVVAQDSAQVRYVVLARELPEVG
jgi:RimJ/RimL family protein N-acetyltransferase